ncbi:MAG TPA: Hint domain-containing protein [Paracoccus sp. (in: a-proteobacteria)]|nr:Hint domain-containing protein [Paracoccus sp. (in: a-proteobacteria)]
MTKKPPAPLPDSGDNHFKAIYLGDLDSSQHIDKSEWAWGAENADALNGVTFGGPGAALAGNIVDMTLKDGDGDGELRSENGFWGRAGFEGFSTGQKIAAADSAGKPCLADRFDFDAAQKYTATITFCDGTTTARIVVTLIQDDLGRIFAVPSLKDSFNDALEAGPIQSITLHKPYNDGTSNSLAVNRPDVGFVPCFAEGTRILTARGQRPIERIAVGDLVVTADHGPQAVCWHGTRRLDAADLAAHPNLRHIRIRKGALGNRLPRRDLLVSPRHRMLVRSDIAQRLFGAAEVLVAARHLLALDGAEVAEDVVG